MKIIKRFLSSLCDEELYNKFGFDEFFQQKLTSDDTTVYVNFEDMQIQILKRCLEVLRWEHGDNSFITNLYGYVGQYFQVHLGRVDLSLSDPDTKQEVGELLLSVLTEPGCIAKWWEQSPDTLRQWWLYDEDETYVNNVARWLSDTAVTRSETIDEDARHWAEKFKSSSSLTSNFVVLEKVAEYMADQWLDGQWASGDIGPFAFLHSYLSKLRVGPHSKTMDPVLEDPTAEMDIVHIYESKNWAMQEFEMDVHESEAIRNVGRTLRELGHYDEAIIEFKKSAEMMEDNWLPLWGLAGTYELQGEFKLAIETLEPVMERVESGEAKTDYAAEELGDMLFDLGQWNVNIENPSRGLELFHRILEKQNPKDARTVFEIVKVHQNQSAFHVTMDLLRRLDNEHDDTENCSRLICVCMDLIKEQGLWEETILDAARLTGNLPFLRQKCEDALAHAKLKLKAPEDLEDSLVTTLASFYFQYGCLMYQYPIDEHDAASITADETRAIELWEEIIRLCKTYTWISDLKLCARETSKKLAYVYVDRGRREKGSSDQSLAYLSKLRVLGNSGENSFDMDLNAALLESYYYSANGDTKKYKEALLPAVKDAFDLLSDDDPSNDWVGYGRLGAYLHLVGDDINSKAAYQLITPKYFTRVEAPEQDAAEDDSDEDASAAGHRESQADEDEVEEEQEGVGEEEEEANDHNEDEKSEHSEEESSDQAGPNDSKNQPVSVKDHEEADQVNTDGVEDANDLSSQPGEDDAAEREDETAESRERPEDDDENASNPSESPTTPLDEFDLESGPLDMTCDMTGCPRIWGFMSDVHHCRECVDISYCSEHLMIVRGRKGRWVEGVWVEENADMAAHDGGTHVTADQRPILNREPESGNPDPRFDSLDADTASRDYKTSTKASTLVNGIQLEGRNHFAVTCRASHTFLSIPPYDENEVGRVIKAAPENEDGNKEAAITPTDAHRAVDDSGGPLALCEDEGSNTVDSNVAQENREKGEDKQTEATAQEGLAQINDEEVRPPTKYEVLVAGEIMPIRDWIEALKADWGVVTNDEGVNETQLEAEADTENTAREDGNGNAEEPTAGEQEERASDSIG